ncbi:MAG: TonB-dependent receptor [Blastocatellia bacterium]|nr:TonB-dependent receptor [Blastocatellia bacterium]
MPSCHLRRIVFGLLLAGGFFWYSTQLAAPVRAQSSAVTGGIVGRVTDIQGGSLGGAVVSARHIDTNLNREIQTDEAGEFQFLQLPPGNYEVKTAVDGFAAQTVKLTLTIGTTGLVRFRLNAAGASEVIEVQGNQTEKTTESSTVLTRRQIDSLPINRRNFLDFALTTPRATADGLGGQGVLATSGISFNGQSARANNISIDGLDNNDRATGAVRTTFSQEAVQEFQVVSDGFSAEFGRATGGILNIVTRTGTNDFHGNLFFFNRNDTISARDVFIREKAPFTQNQFGATLGGPIRPNRVFFFTSFERLTTQQNNIVTIPEGIERAGNAAGFRIRNGPSPFSVGKSVFLARTDMQLSANDSLWVRYNSGFTNDSAYEPFGGFTAPSAGGRQKLTENTVAVGNTYVSLGQNLVQETRFLYSWRDQSILPFDGGPAAQIDSGAGSVRAGRANLLPNFRDEQIAHLIHNLTLVRGAHQLKFGGDYQMFRGLRTSTPILFGGLFNFGGLGLSRILPIPNLPAISAEACLDPQRRTPQEREALNRLSVLLPEIYPTFPKNIPLADIPLPISYLQGFGKPVLKSTSTYSVAAYVQDEYKARSNLLLKAGLRYDLNRIFAQPDNAGNFSPRLGLAWQPQRIPRLAVRAGYGLFFGGSIAANNISSKLLESGQIVVRGIPFPFSILPLMLPNERFPESEMLPQGLPFIAQLGNTTRFQPDLRNSYSQQANLTLGYALTDSLTLSAAYTYVRGIKLQSVRDINPIIRFERDLVVSAITGRVDPTQGTVYEIESAFDSYYHAFTLALEKRLTRRANFLVHYTLSKTIDNASDIFVGTVEVGNTLQPGQERGLSLQDARQRLTASGIWNLDYTNHPLLRGFQISAIFNARTGPPYNLLAGIDLDNSGDTPTGDRPPGLGRNVGIAPGFIALDVRLSRLCHIGEKVRLEALAEGFNILNRTNISELNRVFPPAVPLPGQNPTFPLPPKDGSRYSAPPNRYRNAYAPRQFQFGVRITF